MAQLHLAPSLTVSYDIDELVRVYEVAIRQVLEHRPTVAFRYGDKDRHVSVILGASSGVFAVYDTAKGPDIASEHWQSVLSNLITAGVMNGVIDALTQDDLDDLGKSPEDADDSE